MRPVRWSKYILIFSNQDYHNSFKNIYKFKSLTVNGDADEPHDVGYAYDYCVVQCPKLIEKILIYYKIFPKN